MTETSENSTTGLRSRRALIRAGMGLMGSGIALCGLSTASRAQDAAAPAAQKLEQSAVMYQKTPKNGQLCSICVNFQGPHACAIVGGVISPTGWCVAFAPKA